ncbi:MAG: hypothetical protein ACEPOV_08645 [Hyphomicrobiales bacterium]
MKHKFLLIYAWFVRTILFFLPDIPFIMRFRGWLYGLGMRKRGRDFQVTHNTIIKSLQNIEVGNNVFIGNFSVILAAANVIVHDEVQIGPNVIIISGNHTKLNGSYRFGKPDREEIILERGSWVSANCTIAKGSMLPSGSVLAANSLLNKKHTTKDGIYGGVPAKLLKKE